MIYKYSYDSDSIVRPDGLCSRLEVSCNLWSTGNNGDHGYDALTITNLDTGLEVPYESLSESEKTRIDKTCDEASYEYGPEAYKEALETQSEAAYDAWKERDWE